VLENGHGSKADYKTETFTPPYPAEAAEMDWYPMWCQMYKL